MKCFVQEIAKRVCFMSNTNNLEINRFFDFGVTFPEHVLAKCFYCY